MHNLHKLTRAGFLQLLLMLLFIQSNYAQDDIACDTSVRYAYWTGEVNNDFFNEKNWRVTVEKTSTQSDSIHGRPTCLPGGGSHLYLICPNVHDAVNDKYPKDKSLEPGQPIRFNLYIESASVTANGGISFACTQKGITLTHAQLTVQGGTVSQGALSLLNESTVHLKEGGMSPTLLLNFSDAASWVYLNNENPDALMSKLGNIRINHVAGVLDNNFRINQYYQKGAVIRPLSASHLPLTIFSGTAQSGSSAKLQEDVIYAGATIPGGLDNAARSFILKRGYMATFSINSNGTGKSKVYIASEVDLKIDALDIALQGNVSFMRVVPWNWVIKKGTGGFYDQLNTGWFYNWNNNNNSLPNYEYVPMAWGASGALPASINLITQKKKTTHVLGFNESDNCEDQSGQFNNLCQPAVAVAYYENLMGLGVRLGTPAPRENGPTTWLLEFAKIAKERNVRFDFVAVHWYDWGSSPANSPNADPQQIFNRFKAYLANVHNIYQLPIWITEFNANPNRGNPIQEAFLRLALPYLESLDYVERYAYFQPNPQYAQVPQTPANYYDANGAITNIGELYMHHESTPSIPEATLECPNNLEGLNLPYVSIQPTSFVFEAECGRYIGNQWSVLENTEASNDLYIRGNDLLEGASPLAKQVHFEFDLAEAGAYRMWIRAASTAGAGALRISVDGKTFEQISPFTSATFTWFQVPRFYDLGEGKHRFSVEFPNSNMLLDQVLFTNGIENFELLKKESDYCAPDVFKWGLETTNVENYYEAEVAAFGSDWRTQISANAIGGLSLSSAEGVNSIAAPAGTEKVISFSLQVDKPGEYDIWAKIQATDPSANNLWIAVNGESYRKWSALNNATYEWYWKKFHYSYGSENRAFTYFLTAGHHEVKVAIGSGFVFADRLAVVTKGKLPATTDPDVLLLTENLEFEAENARFIAGTGTTGVVPATVSCATSSNLLQVNLGNKSGNWIAFENVVADAAGPYKLKIAYMSKISRPFRIRVNGITMSRQVAAPSGNWCYVAPDNPTLGSPAIYEVVVILKRGLNTIEIGLNNVELAPFIDKIKLEKAELNGLALEAETAELFSTNNTTVITNCSVASNGALVNMVASINNGIRYNNLVSEESKTYQVDIYYITKVQRNLRVSINAEPFTTLDFVPSGNWCFETSPVLARKSVQLSFAKGSNIIEFRPTGADAPFIDKIVIREPAAEITTAVEQQEAFAANIGRQLIEETIAKEIEVYPNPVETGSPITLMLPGSATQAPLVIQITDASGRVVIGKTIQAPINRQVRIENRLSKGIYILSVKQGLIRSSNKIIIH